MRSGTASNRTKAAAEQGSVLLVAAILLGIAMLALSSILIAASGHSRINYSAYQRERAFLLAESGLAAAIRELNNGNSGNILLAQSHGYFQKTNAFSESHWGFATLVTDQSGGGKQVSSTGHFGKQQAVVSMNLLRETVERNIHSLYAYALFAGNSSGDTNYVLQIGGTGAAADQVDGDVYSGNDIAVTGDAVLRLPEVFTDSNGNGYWDEGEPRHDSGTQVFHSNALTQAEFDTYTGTVDRALVYPNGRYDPGEAFVDTIGNGVYDQGEAFTDVNGDGMYGFGEPFVDANGNGTYDPAESFTDSNGNGVYDPATTSETPIDSDSDLILIALTPGEPFVDANGNGIYDAGESFTDHGNGQYDPGETFVDENGDGIWNPEIAGFTDGEGVWHPPVPAEPYADEGNGVYDPIETFEDRNRIYDPGEAHFDDRNGRYDYGTRAAGNITGMPAPGAGQQAAAAGVSPIATPDLARMYYDRPRTVTQPADALDGWGHDVDVASAAFDANGRVITVNSPAHIFVKNPTDRTYASVPGKDDYFLEDPGDATYGESSQLISVSSDHNNKVYYIDGNLHLGGNAVDYRFRHPGSKITIVANGNITISDEFRYNGGTANPQDSLSLIALADPAYTNSGNIYLGDAQAGTGGDIHAMLLAENNFVDVNLDTGGQPYLDVFGNMAAGNQLVIDRSGAGRTQLRLTFDERIVDGSALPPGLPAALPGQRRIYVPGDWKVVHGTWHSYSNMR